MSTMLEIKGLHTSYGRIPMLMDVNLDIAEGEVSCVLGANGSGKTTLVKAILNMVKADSGTMKLNGVSIDDWPTHKRVEGGIALSAAASGTFPKMTVETNLKMGAFYINDSAV